MFSDSENDDDQYAFESDEETRRRVLALQRAQAEQAAHAAAAAPRSRRTSGVSWGRVSMHETTVRYQQQPMRLCVCRTADTLSPLPAVQPAPVSGLPLTLVRMWPCQNDSRNGICHSG